MKLKINFLLAGLAGQTCRWAESFSSIRRMKAMIPVRVC
jgi:hypothetical protein